MWLHRCALVIMTLWIGGLWITGLSANTLFKVVADRTLAGNIAGALFTTISYVGIVSALLLMTIAFVEQGAKAFKQYRMWAIVIMLVLVLLGHFGIQPWLADLKQKALPVAVMQSAYAADFAFGHGVAGAVYLLECLLGLFVVVSTKVSPAVVSSTV